MGSVCRMSLAPAALFTVVEAVSTKLTIWDGSQHEPVYEGGITCVIGAPKGYIQFLSLDPHGCQLRLQGSHARASLARSEAQKMVAEIFSGPYLAGISRTSGPSCALKMKGVVQKPETDRTRRPSIECE